MRCHICNQDFDISDSRKHIYLFHKWKTKDYYDQFIKSNSEGICEFCGNPTTFISLEKGYRQSCSNHAHLLAARTIERKYGVDNISKLESIKQKKIDTCMKNHGVRSLLHHEGREQLENHNLKNFGVKNLASLDETKKTIKKTFNRKYGVDCALQNSDSMLKFKNTCKDRFGVDHPMQNKDVSMRSQQTCRDRLGISPPLKNEKCIQKSKETCLLKFGVDNYSKTFESRLKSRERILDRIEEQTGEKARPMEGSGEKPCFDELEKHIPYTIVMGTSKISYFPDGLIEELKLVIEFDEPDHERLWYQKHDKKRDEDFLRIGYYTFRIKQTEWLGDKEMVVRKLKQVIMKRKLI